MKLARMVLADPRNPLSLFFMFQRLILPLIALFLAAAPPAVATQSTPEYAALKEANSDTLAILSGAADYVTSGSEAADVEASSSYAVSAFENNYLNYQQLVSFEEAMAACGEDRDCLNRTYLNFYDISAEQQHQLAMCGNDLNCLAPHLQNMSLAQTHPVWQSMMEHGRGALAGLEFQAHQVYLGYETENNLPLLLQSFAPNDPDYASAYIGYSDWATSNCTGISGSDCMQRFQQGPAHANLFWQGMTQGAEAFATSATIGLGGGVIAGVAPGAVATLRACAANPLCWAEMSVAAGELGLGLTGATAGQTFFTVAGAGSGAAGMVVLQKGNDIVAVIDDLGRMMKPSSQGIDDSGRLIVQSADGAMGYFDNGRFVLTRPATNRTGIETSNGALVRPADSPNYSVATEVQLPTSAYPGVSHRRHNQISNQALHEAFEADPAYAAQMENLYPGIVDGVRLGPRGAFPDSRPTPDVTWHHGTEPGQMQLVPFDQHTAPGPVQGSLHPGGSGGYADWGTE